MFSYMASIYRCRFFWMSLVKMDLRTRYRRSILGLGWSLLHPIAMTTILCFVFHRIFKVSAEEYAPTLMAGLAFWTYFQGVTLQGCSTFFLAESYIRQYPSPLAIFPLRTALGAGIHFLMALGVAIVLASYTLGIPNPLALLSLVPTLALLFLLGWGLALLAGIATVLFQDSEHLATVGFQILFYATPIIYTDETIRANNLTWLMHYNPLVAFLNLLRDPLIKHQAPSWHTYGAATATVLIVAGLAFGLLYRVQRRFIFYL
ncbi:MAG: ABC transporter permease [Gemmataceae bacterium]|nr:ABC transporter permease [Gemmataceae bacterium]